MKLLISIFILVLPSAILYAQNNKPLDTMSLNKEKLQTNNQVSSNPNISITPDINTTITTQPAGIPNSNTNPTTGTVISIKSNKNISKESKPSATINPGSQPLLKRSDTTLNQNMPGLKKQAVKKKKVAVKKKISSKPA